MWKLVYFVLVGHTPVAYTHPVDFHTEYECVQYFNAHSEDLNNPSITWVNSFCVEDRKEIRH